VTEVIKIMNGEIPNLNWPTGTPVHYTEALKKFDIQREGSQGGRNIAKNWQEIQGKMGGTTL